MPIKPESLVKVYLGTRYVNVSRPVLIVTAQTEVAPYSEHFFVSSIPEHEVISRATTYSVANSPVVMLNNLPEVFGAPGLLAHEFLLAEGNIEFSILKIRPAAHEDLFCSLRPLKFEERESALLHLALTDVGRRGLRKVKSQTKNTALLDLLNTFLGPCITGTDLPLSE